MAEKRISQITETATEVAADDYLALDGATNGTRKILASGIGGGGFEFRNRESVDTGNIWIDGRHIKVFCFSYSGQSGNQNLASLTDFGFNDTINNYVDIRTQYRSSVGEFHTQGGYCYSWRATNDRISTYINMDGTIYIQFYYT